MSEDEEEDIFYPNTPVWIRILVGLILAIIGMLMLLFLPIILDMLW